MVKPGRAVIKKYANRRLYDTSASRYINLEDIAALIRKGADVQVVDAKTGQDLTRVTLTQVILEDTRDQPAGLPLELLRQLIVVSDTARQEFMRSAYDTYARMQDALRSGLTSAALSPLQTVRKLVGKTGEGDELQELRRRVAELEARVGRQRPAGTRKSKRKRDT